MKRPEFTPEEKVFFRTCFPRFSRSDVPIIMNGNRGVIVYSNDGSNGGYGTVLFPPDSVFMFINSCPPQEQVDITIIHEMLHGFYEENRDATLYHWLCDRYGRLMDKYAIFLKKPKRGNPGSVYYGQWEEFLDDEAQTLHEDDPGLATYIRTFFREKIYQPKWRKRCTMKGQFEWVYE